MMKAAADRRKKLVVDLDVRRVWAQYDEQSRAIAARDELLDVGYVASVLALREARA